MHHFGKKVHCSSNMVFREIQFSLPDLIFFSDKVIGSFLLSQPLTKKHNPIVPTNKQVNAFSELIHDEIKNLPNQCFYIILI